MLEGGAGKHQNVGAVFLFSVLARCLCLVAAFMLEGGAVEHPECWRGILVYCVGTVFLFKALARYSCLVAAFILEGGAEEHA